MSKQVEFLLKIGVPQTQIDEMENEDSDIEAIATNYKEAQFKLFQADPKHNDKVKDESKQKGLAEAFTKSKKELNTKFSLGYTNAQLEDKKYEELVEEVNEKYKNAGTEEVTKVNEKLFEVSKKLAEKEEEITNKVKETADSYTSKMNKILSSQLATKIVSTKKYTIPQDEAEELYMLKAEKNGIEFKFDEQGKNPTVWKDGYQLKKADNTAFETPEGLATAYLGAYEQKSNGNDQQQRQTAQIETKDIKNPTLQHYIQKAESAAAN